ncbi:DUF362 domain-containing protein [candidate division KSB1 bacterium]|nr:DUF362 domain-containing protein [candidate division KSB1 bacterium]
MPQINRRQFLKSSVVASGGTLLASLPHCQANEKQNALDQGSTGKSRVVIARNNAVRTPAGKLDASQVEKTLNEALRTWFQITSLDTIWRKILKPDDVVGIKVNCLAGKGLSTSKELVDVIIEGAQRAGLRETNIIVWDRLNSDLKRAGYPINERGFGVKYLGNDAAGYSSEIMSYGRIGSLLSRIVTDRCTALINVPILKDHGIVGMSVALKNYFGAIHNPNKYHSNIGDPYVSDVNMLPPLRDKTRFTICDVFTAQYEGGPPFMPQWAWNYNGLIVGKDMVAIDQVGWTIIEEKRKREGYPSLKQAGREPTYIATAADANHRLGTNDMQQIELINV